MTWLFITPSLIALALAVVSWWRRRRMTDAELFPELIDGGDDAGRELPR